MALNQYHMALQATTEFRQLIKILKDKTPSVTGYDPDQDNIRRVVWESALRRGFELAIKHLES